MLLLTWLSELVEDYRRGSRSAKVYCIRDVAGCSRRDACLCLSRSGWDVEAALQSFYIGNKPKAAAGAKLEGALSAESEAEKSWSSGGAKLRRNEVECPICVVPYEQGYKPVMTQCCFQVLCSECLCRLTDSRGQLACPFCRRGNEAQDDQVGDESGPESGRAPAPRSLGGALQTAADSASGGARQFVEWASELHVVGRPERPSRRRRGPSSRGSGTAEDSASSPTGSESPSRTQVAWEQFRQLAPACLLCSAYIAFSICSGSTGS
ncbi:unnamed protein product [Polarella glacialis]|uniref:RING-type domain-containing protein n=1 Tax=Polarella glacialis TaxID=89957 RepID=A0A813IY42_POLGL|nr:unnamed protein product [Polarella glacialis]